jgi:hypothetical protein
MAGRIRIEPRAWALNRKALFITAFEEAIRKF